jgi:hypothetical protein
MGNGGMGFPRTAGITKNAFDCAVVLEETGYSMDSCTIIRNILPFEKTLRVKLQIIIIKYFIMFMKLTLNRRAEFSRPR